MLCCTKIDKQPLHVSALQVQGFFSLLPLACRGAWSPRQIINFHATPFSFCFEECTEKHSPAALRCGLLRYSERSCQVISQFWKKKKKKENHDTPPSSNKRKKTLLRLLLMILEKLLMPLNLANPGIWNDYMSLLSKWPLFVGEQLENIFHGPR